MSSKSSNLRSILFATGLSIIVSLALTFAANQLKPLQEQNQKLDQQKNIMKVLGLYSPDEMVSAETLIKRYEQVLELYVNPNGTLSKTETELPIYILAKQNRLVAYALPISGYGLWSTLYGYFSMEADGRTVKGITFYAHGETPGLGAECDQPWFQEQFVGKKIVDRSGQFVSVGIVKGSIENVVSESEYPYYVDGISGATVTSVGIQNFIKADLLKYEPFSSRIRKRQSVWE